MVDIKWTYKWGGKEKMRGEGKKGEREADLNRKDKW